MASLIHFRPALRRDLLHVLLAAFACAFLGMGKKEPPFTVRFYAEAKKEDTDRFAKPITFRGQHREGFIENIPSIHEKNIKAVYPVEAADGTWGCTFVLDHSGRMALEVLSTTRRGSTVVAFVGTKNGAHQVVELLVDKPITDGVIFIPSGLTEMEIQTIIKTWPVVGQPKKKK